MHFVQLGWSMINAMRPAKTQTQTLAAVRKCTASEHLIDVMENVVNVLLVRRSRNFLPMNQLM